MNELVNYLISPYTNFASGNLDLPQPLPWSGMHNPQTGSRPRTCYIRPSQQVKKYGKLLVNDSDFMNEFKLHWTIYNFAIYYNLKQLLMATMLNHKQQKG